MYILQKSFVLTPNGQIWPRALNTDIGGVAGNIYLVVAAIGNNSGSGLDFIKDRKSTRLNSSHSTLSRMPSSA